MSVLRTIKCPACGKTHLLGKACACGGAARREPSRAPRVAGIVLTFVLTGGGIVGLALLLAATLGIGYGIAAAVGAWLLLHVCRLGYDWDDGIDVRQRVFPGPFDWPVKLESLVNFWTAERPYFRAAYLGAAIAAAIVIVMLLAELRG